MPLRKVSRCHQDLIEILYKVADILNIRNIEYVIEFGTEDIDIFYCGIYQAHIKGFRDGQKIKHTLIIKWHADPKKRAYFRELYHRDFIFHQQIVPELLDIQRQFRVIDGLRIKFPNCIFANIEYDKETIVAFQADAFRASPDRFQKVDLEHATLVMKNLAKLHALSFVLERTKPKYFKKIKVQCGKDVQYSDPEFISKSIECYYSTSVSVVSDPVAKEKLRAIVPNIAPVLHRCVSPGPYSVVCHADCWNNNSLFHYKRNRPVEILFIDYQLWRLASPVTDISYYFYMCSEKELLVQHYDHLIRIYYGTLTGVLRQCNLDVEEIYPEDVFQTHLRRFSVLGLIEALISMKIITAATEEACQMTEMKYHTEDELSESVSQNQSLYVERVNGVVNDFFERGYSLDGVLNNE